MPLRFRKSQKIGPVRVTLGKRGVSTSVGSRYHRVTVGRRGVTQSVSAPGTGIGYQTRGCRRSAGMLLLGPALGLLALLLTQ